MRKSLRNATFLLLAWATSAIAGPIEDCQEYAQMGVPSQNGMLLCRTGYFLDHDPVRKTPYWVAEHLTADKASAVLKRQGSFKAHPDLAKGKRAEKKDYERSGYDQGHMTPSADMTWSLAAMKESFFLSNMAPQQGIGMNRGIWKVLEEKVRGWAINRGELYIYTGPSARTVTHDRQEQDRRSLVYDPTQQEAIAFLMPNIKLKTKDMPEFIVSIRTIENETGLDFLSELEPSVQEAVEVNRATALWNE